MNRFWLILLLIVGLKNFAYGQTGLAIDWFEPAPSATGLLATHSAEIQKGRIEALLGADWAYHLLGIKISEIEQIEWIVKDRLSIHVSAGYSPSNTLRLAAGFSGAVLLTSYA